VSLVSTLLLYSFDKIGCHMNNMNIKSICAKLCVIKLTKQYCIQG